MMKSRNKLTLSATIITLLILLAASGSIMSLVNEPNYTVIQTADNIQIRKYSPMIVAQVSVSGDRKSAISAGFKILADYIFGNNQGNKKLSKSEGSVQEEGEKIAMTAPVMQQEFKQAQQWTVKFVMPLEYTIENLPRPNNNQVKIVSVPAKSYAVISFSGLASESSLEKNLAELVRYLSANKIKSFGKPVFAFYNPPWTLPFLRRNEIMLQIDQD